MLRQLCRHLLIAGLIVFPILALRATRVVTHPAQAAQEDTPTPPAEEDEEGEVTITPGTTYQVQLLSGGLLRRYLVYVPTGYESGTPAPLVFNFHGRGSNPLEQRTISQMSVKADEGGFIVVYPEGLNDPPNWSFLAGSEQSGVDDVGFVRDLIDSLSNHLNIDPARIYATGYSNGGGMANRLACDLSDQIAAIAQVAGTYPIPEGCLPARPVPVMTFHGTADGILPYNGVEGVLLSARAWVANWAVRNGCEAGPTVTLEEGEVFGETWSDCLDNAEVVLYTVEGGGHSWPRTHDIPEADFEVAITDINATDLMWAFFEAHPMPDEPSAAVALPEGAEEAKHTVASVRQPGDFLGMIESGGLTRQFVLHVPPGYTDGAPLPLVLAFHGYGDDPINFARNSGLISKADEGGFIVVFPEGAGDPRAWSSWPDDMEPDDVQFVRDLVDKLTDDLDVDPARIYATGFSRGGRMTNRLGCELADLIAAIAPVGAGAYPSEACAPARPIPVLAIHGTADGAIPYEGDANDPPVQEWVGDWAARNGCDATPTVDETSIRFQVAVIDVSIETWGDCEADADVVLHSYDNWGHFWPTGAGPDVIWAFFSTHPMPEVED